MKNGDDQEHDGWIAQRDAIDAEQWLQFQIQDYLEEKFNQYFSANPNRRKKISLNSADELKTLCVEWLNKSANQPFAEYSDQVIIEIVNHEIVITFLNPII